MKKILVIDDEINIVNSVGKILQENKFSPILCPEAKKAIKLFQEEKPDLALVDIWMADMDGYSLLSEFKKIDSKVPVIMISGHANIATSVETVKRGADDFLEKPFSTDSLIDRINNLLHTKSSKKKQSNCYQEKLDRLLRETDEYQKTINKNLVITGKGLHHGKNTGIILSPLPEDSGIIFKDISTGLSIKANIENVSDTNFFNTTFKSGSFSLSVIEHLLSTLHIYGIDNLQVKVSEEIPILDGSSIGFCELLDTAEIVIQAKKKKAIFIDKEYTYRDPKNPEIEIKMEPYDDLLVNYYLEFPKAFGNQSYTIDFKNKNRREVYKKEIAPCRTFGFVDETKTLQAQGLAQGANLDNALLVHQDKVINAQLKFKNEFARHKVLDIIGDIYLFGSAVHGKVSGHKSGHRHTVNLIKQILS